MRTELKPEEVTAIVDSREQLPWTLAPLKTTPGSLPTGDYSLVGLEECVALERKSLDDLLGCIGRERERFERELQRLNAYRHRLLLVEASWEDLEAGNWRSQVTPAAATGSVIAWLSQGLPIVMAGNRQRADTMAARWLFTIARRYWRSMRHFVKATEANA